MDRCWSSPSHSLTRYELLPGNQGVKGQFPSADLSKGVNVLSVPQVSVIKVKIHEATGMPAGKQKLQYEVSQVSGPSPWFVPEAKSPVEPKEGGHAWMWPPESIQGVMTLLGEGAGAG